MLKEINILKLAHDVLPHSSTLAWKIPWTEKPDRLQSMGSQKSESEFVQSCPTLCDRMDCSLPHSSVHGIFQARVLEWVAISFSRGSSRPRDQTQDSHIVGRHFTIWATREVSQGSRIWEAPGKEAQDSSRGDHLSRQIRFHSAECGRTWSLRFSSSASQSKFLGMNLTCYCITTFHQQIFNKRTTHTPK